MRAIAVCFVFLFIGIWGVLTPVEVFASSESLWSEGGVVVLKNESATVGGDNACLTYKQEMVIAELHETRNVCVYGDQRLMIGNFTEAGVIQAAVQLPYSEETHVLEGICVGVTCRYSADTDTLVTIKPFGHYGWGLVVYKNVAKRISKVQTTPSVSRYVFDASHPDYELKNSVDNYIAVQSFNMSDNGEWVVVELRDHGIALLDTTNLTLRHIETSGHQYGYGMDPDLRLAVSDNGKNVAVGGLNGGFSVIDVVEGCGQRLVDDLALLTGTVRCAAGDLGIGLLFSNFRLVDRLHFIGSGHELEVFVKRWNGQNARATLATKGTVPSSRLKFLSLGDSFTSGEGETNDAHYIGGTNIGVDTCHVSSRSYPYLAAAGLSIYDREAKNIACSGAKISDIIGSSTAYWGQGDRLKKVELGSSEDGKTIAQGEAVDNFQPGRALQSSFIDRYSPEIVTIGVGGNDAGLMGKLHTCAMPGTCEWAQGQGIEKTAVEINRLSGKLGTLFAGISESTKNSQVYIVGYPNFIDPNGHCDPVTAFLFDSAERLFIKNSVHYLNQIIRAAAVKAGYVYVDTERSIEGKELCSGSTSMAMNGLRFGGDISVISALPMLKIFGFETFHPTPVGHSLMAEEFLKEYADQVHTPTFEDTDVTPAAYWDVESVEDAPTTYVSDFAFVMDEHPRHMTIQVPDAMLEPSSEVRIEIHSEPAVLANVIASSEGGVMSEVAIPDDVKEGFHTLHLFGRNREGESIEMYQFITVGDDGEVLATVEPPILQEPGGVQSAPRASLMPSETPRAPISLQESAFMQGTFSTVGVLGATSSRGVQEGTVQTSTTFIPLVNTGKRYALLVIVIWLTVVLTAIILTFVLRRRWAKPAS